MDYLKRLKGGRGIRYRLEVILALFILAKLCGQDKPYGIADWLQQRREYLVKALQLSIRYRITAPIGVS